MIKAISSDWPDRIAALMMASMGVLVLAGPRARDVLAKVTRADVANEAFPWLAGQRISIGAAPVDALRVNFIGELGWEIHAMRDGLRAKAAARAVGVSRATLYRWAKDLVPKSRRPLRVRERQWSPELALEVERLRQDFPMWGRAKIGPLLREQGFAVSDMTVGRIPAGLIQRGVVDAVQAARKACKTRRWTAQRRHAVRLPKGMKATHPGHIVQIDTVFVQLGPECHAKHFTAYDPVAKWTVGQASRRATSHAADRFLDKVIADMPFAIEAIQVDGGSAFKAEFEAACQAKGIKLYELPPKRPQLNGAVERCNGAWRYKFYGVYEMPRQIDPLNDMINSFQHLYNHHRPHGTLVGQTPRRYLQSRIAETPQSHIC